MNNFLWENLIRKTKQESASRKSLRSNTLFQDLNPAEISLLEKIINVRNYRAGETIFRQGEVGVGMYIIVKGNVNIYVEENVPETGKIQNIHVTQLHEDDFFGDLALVEENGRRSATAVANDECVLIGFFKPDLIEITQRNPVAGVKILMRLGETLGIRLRQTTAKITEMKKLSKVDKGAE